MFGIDQVELVIKSDPALGDGSGVAHLAQRLCTVSLSPPGTTVGVWSVMLTLKPTAHKLDDGLSFGGGVNVFVHPITMVHL